MYMRSMPKSIAVWPNDRAGSVSRSLDRAPPPHGEGHSRADRLGAPGGSDPERFHGNRGMVKLGCRDPHPAFGQFPLRTPHRVGVGADRSARRQRHDARGRGRVVDDAPSRQLPELVTKPNRPLDDRLVGGPHPDLGAPSRTPPLEGHATTCATSRSPRLGRVQPDRRPVARRTGMHRAPPTFLSGGHPTHGRVRTPHWSNRHGRGPG